MADKKRIIQLYRISEYARNKNVDRTTVHSWINSGKVTLYKSPKGISLLNPFETVKSSSLE